MVESKSERLSGYLVLQGVTDGALSAAASVAPVKEEMV